MSEQKGYKTVDELYAGEANGFVAVAILSKNEKTFPRVQGPYENKEDARTASNALRRFFKQQIKEYPNGAALLSVHVEPIWKKVD